MTKTGKIIGTITCANRTTKYSLIDNVKSCIDKGADVLAVDYAFTNKPSPIEWATFSKEKPNPIVLANYAERERIKPIVEEVYDEFKYDVIFCNEISHLRSKKAELKLHTILIPDRRYDEEKKNGTYKEFTPSRILTIYEDINQNHLDLSTQEGIDEIIETLAAYNTYFSKKSKPEIKLQGKWINPGIGTGVKPRQNYQTLKKIEEISQDLGIPTGADFTKGINFNDGEKDLHLEEALHIAAEQNAAFYKVDNISLAKKILDSYKR
jgi:dihydropteroate synthase